MDRQRPSQLPPSIELPDAVSASALSALRGYLDAVGFVRLHKYVVSPQRYLTSVSEVDERSRVAQKGLGALMQGSGAAMLGLAATLMLDRACPLAELSGIAREAAEALLGAGLLRNQGGDLRLADYQLVSVQGLPLFIDARLHFERSASAEVYIGIDSLQLAYYLEGGDVAAGRALDMGTGTGVLALCLSRHTSSVVATDIAPAALRLARLNFALNQRDIELRRESYPETLARAERYQVITCNPPFMPFPDGIDGPVFAQGPGQDGLDHLRQIIERLDEVLLPGGVAYLVADLIGDEHQPYFARDLARYARERDLVIDVYIDSRVDHRIEHTLLRVTANKVASATGADRHQLFERLREHYLVTLAARCNYMAVMVLRKAGPTAARLRVHSRYLEQRA